MAWVSSATFPGKVFTDVREEIDSGSPRATAIVGAAFVEDHLQRLIQARLVNDQKVVDDIFGPSGALGSFSAKINLGYLLGLYTKETYKELDCIRKIRNDFAHELHINDFTIPSIKDRCGNLRIWEKIKVSLTKVEDEQLELQVGSDLEQPKSHGFIVDLAEDGDRAHPRVRYVAACRFFIALFAVLTQINARPKVPSI